MALERDGVIEVLPGGDHRKIHILDRSEEWRDGRVFEPEDVGIGRSWKYDPLTVTGSMTLTG
ncbi:hypothetical protein GCM10018955_54590 [Planomonospora venezuelensis]